MTKRVLVTGADGFVGSHLLEYLQEQGEYELFGTTYSGSEWLNEHLDAEHIKVGDLADLAHTAHMIQDVQPDWVIHLASLSVVAGSHQKTLSTIQKNTAIQFAMLEAVREHAPQARVLSIGSATCYGQLPDKWNAQKIDESYPFYPNNPYAVSKATQEYLALSYYLSYDLDVVRVRPFNQIGPRQTPDFAVPAFASQVVAVERAEQDHIAVGNLDAVRDFTDVRDAVRAYELLMQSGSKGEVYNLGSGHGVAMQTVLDELIEEAHTEITVKPDPARMRPSDVPVFVADASKLRQLGWEPTIARQQTLRDVLEFERNRNRE